MKPSNGNQPRTSPLSAHVEEVIRLQRALESAQPDPQATNMVKRYFPPTFLGQQPAKSDQRLFTHNEDQKTILTEKNQQLTKRNRQLAVQLAKKNQQLAKKNQQLAKKDQQLAKKDQQLAKKDQQLFAAEEKTLYVQWLFAMLQKKLVKREFAYQIERQKTFNLTVACAEAQKEIFELKAALEAKSAGSSFSDDDMICLGSFQTGKRSRDTSARVDAQAKNGALGTNQSDYEPDRKKPCMVPSGSSATPSLQQALPQALESVAPPDVLGIVGAERSGQNPAAFFRGSLFVWELPTGGGEFSEPDADRFLRL